MQISDPTFDDWVRQYSRLLFGIAYWWTGSRSDAEELTQEAFFQAYRSLSSLKDIEAVKGWLVGILRNCYSQTRRKGQASTHISIDEMLNEPHAKDLITDEILSLHQSLKRLEEHHRLPLVLFYFEDLSYREISHALDIPVGTVMSRLARAKQILHSQLAPSQKLNVLPKREER